MADRRRAVDYALEGSIFIAGAVVQWLRDGLGIISIAAEIEALAAQRAGQRRRVSRAGVRRARRAALGSRTPAARIVRLTRGTTARAHRARGARVRSPLRSPTCSKAMEADAGHPLGELRVDGGAARTTC